MLNAEANIKLKGIVSKWAAEYNRAAEASRTSFMHSLRGGDRLPAPGHIYGNDAKAAFDDLCVKYRAEAQAVIGEIAGDLREQMLAAPSAEAVNTISLLALRKDLTAEEVEGLLNKYGDNVQAFKAIASVAASNGLRGYECPTEAALDNLNGLASVLFRDLTTASAEVGHASEAYVSILNAQIDMVLPA